MNAESLVPTREEFLHISQAEQVLFYALACLAVALLAYPLWKRSRLWMRGRPLEWRPAGLRGVWRYVLLQKKVKRARKRSGAPMHLLIFYGFLALFLATTLLAINTYSPVKFHKGTYYLVYEATFDALGVLFVVGVGWAIVRRLGCRPRSLSQDGRDWVALAMLFVLGVTGYVLEAARLGYKLAERGSMDPFDVYSFVGYGLAQAIGPVSADAYKTLWWFHAILAFALIASLPHLRLRHLVVAIFSAFGSAERPLGELKTVSMEEVERTGRIGASEASDLSRWHLLSLDACMECGRCTEVCPANGVGKPLDPKRVVQDVRGAMASGMSIAEAVTEEALWACTTCGACVEACPVLIRHVDLIVDARRYLVAEGRFSGTGSVMLRQVGATGSAWGVPADSREDWMKGLDVRLCREGEPFDVLLWVGCAGATDPGAVKATRALARLLRKAGVRFACLGREETCTGDPARRVGDEFLYQEQARAIAETFRRYGVKRLVTPCPHCFNTFKTDPAVFGEDLTAFHHSQYLADLVRLGKLRIATSEEGKLAFHDPCYLARVNGEEEAPRALFAKGSLVEPKNRGVKTLCCGAGGGRMWMEEPPTQRPGNRRAQELLATGAVSVAVGCPFCRIMLDASLQHVSDRDVRLVDLAEALEEANE